MALTPQERLARFREKKRLAGQCIEAGCRERSNHDGEAERCKACEARHAAKQRERYRRGA